MKKYCIIGIVVLFAGCELVVDVDVPVGSPVLTLNAFMMQDSVWSAQLSLSRHILDETDYKPVTDGLVVIYHNDQAIDTLKGYDNGLYMGDGAPIPGETYEITATSAVHGTIRSTSYVPARTPIDTVEVDLPPAGSGGSGSFEDKFFIRLRMKDRAGEKNFYQIMVISQRTWRSHQSGQEQLEQRLLYINSKDPSIDNENTYSDEGIFFKDLLFDGKDITLSLESDAWQIGGGPMKLVFLLRTVSEDYYRYKTTALLQNETSGNPFAQPTGVYNNIENGFGIFGGFSQSVFVYEKK